MKKIVALSVLAVSAAGAQAALTYDAGATFLDSIANNNVPAYGSGLLDSLISSTAGNLTITFLGKEAGHVNLFSLGSVELRNTAVEGTSVVASVVAGALPFRFKDENDSTSAPNGGNSGAPQGSYVIFGTKGQGSFAPLTSYKGKSYDLIIGWNDGSTVDADYDDHVLGLTLAPVPEPETYAMMLAGLGAMVFVARRRQRR
jgi:hypothetical protein